MIWRHWPLSELQKELDSLFFQKMDQVLPLLDKRLALIYQSSKSDLVRLLTAFADEDYFTNPSKIRRCLNYLPVDEASKLSSLLNTSIIPSDQTSLDFAAKKIAQSRNLRDRFLEFFELGLRFRPATTKKAPPEHERITGPNLENPCYLTSPYKILKDYQHDIFSQAQEIILPPMSRLIIQMPTGSGKTRTAMELISHRFLNGERERVVWLANSEELCEQSIACFKDVWQHVGSKEVDIQRHWGGRPQPSEEKFECSLQFIVVSFQSAWLQMRRNSTESNNSNFESVFTKTTLLVIDEAHMTVAETYSKVCKKIQSLSDCKVIGLTATPGRATEEETTELSDLFHGRILSLRDPHGRWDNPIAYLRSIKVLSHVTYESLEVQSQIRLTKQERQKLATDLDFPSSVLKKIGAQDVRTAEIAARLHRYLKEGARTLIFSPTIENSKFMVSLFTFLGFNAAHVDGTTNSLARAQIIKDFTEGKIQILSNFGILTTGFDAPQTDLLCIARPTKSAVLYSQMIGRGLRGPAVGGTEECRIIEVKDNFLNLGTQDELYTHFKDYWQS